MVDSLPAPAGPLWSLVSYLKPQGLQLKYRQAQRFELGFSRCLGCCNLGLVLSLARLLATKAGLNNGVLRKVVEFRWDFSPPTRDRIRRARITVVKFLVQLALMDDNGASGVAL